MQILKTVGVAFMAMLFSLQVHAERFLTSPLRCGDPSCAFQYTQGPYTPLVMNSILDHSLLRNPATGKWPYGTLNDPAPGGDGVVTAFNGEMANKAPQSTDIKCIGGTISLKPTITSSAATALTNTHGCNPGYASYDEHPGYDYQATAGTEVRAAAPGKVVSGRCVLNGIGSCTNWGYVGIDHGNGYVTQYGHMSTVYVSGGATVPEGKVIGLVGHKGLTSGDHLHFEVLKLLVPGAVANATNTIVVDPYGWTGTGGTSGDPLVSGAAADPRYAANGVTNTRLWADRCDRLTASDPIQSGFGAPYDVLSPYKNVLLRAACDNTGVVFTVGNGLSTQYVYKAGYEWRNNAWTPVTFTGSNPSGDWFVGQAQVRRDRTLAELATSSNFLAYVCTRQTGGSWKCGCRDATCSTAYWQLQSFQQNYTKLWN